MKKWFLPFIVASLVSCDEMNVHKTTSEQIYVEEKKQINWKEVDEYPSFEECKEERGKCAAKCCFEKKISEAIYKQLARYEWEIEEKVSDTVMLELFISEKGVPRIQKLEVDSSLVAQIPDIKEKLQNSIDSLPQIQPASKRGIPVSTIFKLPIIVVSE